jgi:hypothetical protein
MARLVTLDVKAAGNAAFGLTNYNQLKNDVDYLIIAGADLASAATINPTAEFHGVTGTTTIDNLVDTLGAIAGQQVRLWIKGGPLTIRNQGGGAGNIRTAIGLDRVCAPNEIVSFVYDGAVWREQGAKGNRELAYATYTATLAVSATTEAGANAVVTTPAYTYDGATRVKVEFDAPRYVINGATAAVVVMFRDTTAIGWCFYHEVTAASSIKMNGEIYDTPAAGSHTYTAKIFQGASTGSLIAGVGGPGNNKPATLRVERAD